MPKESEGVVVVVVTDALARCRRQQIWRLQRYWAAGFTKSYLNKYWTCCVRCFGCLPYSNEHGQHLHGERCQSEKKTRLG